MSLRWREAVDAGKPRVPTTSTVRVRWSPANCSRPTIHRTTHPTLPVSTTSTQSPTSEYGSRSTRFSYSLPIPGNGRVSITLSITTSSQPLCWQMYAVSTRTVAWRHETASCPNSNRLNIAICSCFQVIFFTIYKPVNTVRVRRPPL